MRKFTKKDFTNSVAWKKFFDENSIAFWIRTNYNNLDDYLSGNSPATERLVAKEVAEMFNLPEEEIKDWFEENDDKAYRILEKAFEEWLCKNKELLKGDCRLVDPYELSNVFGSIDRRQLKEYVIAFDNNGRIKSLVLNYKD